MKTQEEVARQHAVGPINIYKIYQEGYQDRELDDWESFRREAAKDILAGMLSAAARINIGGKQLATFGDFTEAAIKFADGLIAKLKEQ